MKVKRQDIKWFLENITRKAERDKVEVTNEYLANELSNYMEVNPGCINMDESNRKGRYYYSTVGYGIFSLLGERYRMGRVEIFDKQNDSGYQVDEGVYACVPRCGKQRASYSSIENMFVDYEGFCYGVIISNQELFDINLPFQYKVIDGKNIKQDIESILQTHSNVDYIFFTDNAGVNVKDVIKYFKLFAIHKLPYISFENNLFISKKYLNVLYEESIINNFQDIIKRYSD